jgi:hypothetical protein
MKTPPVLADEVLAKNLRAFPLFPRSSDGVCRSN